MALCIESISGHCMQVSQPCSAAHAYGASCTPVWPPVAPHMPPITHRPSHHPAPLTPAHHHAPLPLKHTHQAYKRYSSSCGSEDPNTRATTKEECDAFGPSCEWVSEPNHSVCMATPVALLTSVFGLDESTDPTIAGELACANATEAAACGAVGGNVTLPEGLLAAAREGALAITTDISTVINATINATANATAGGNTTGTPTTAHTGGAAAVHAGPAAVMGALLLGALLL